MNNETLDSLAEIEFYKPLSITVAGFAIPVITGFISVASSSLLLYIIYISKKTKLLTSYHRIMASMSAFDIISSTCVVFRQTFMPKDHMVYQFQGPIIGNYTTCRMEGWFIIFGICGATASTACLCWYFVFSIVFKVDMKKITKYIAPLMYIYILSISVAVPTFFTKIDMMNPNLTTGTCDIAPYPISCNQEKWWDWNECTWEEGVLETYFENQYVFLYALVLQFVLVFIGMSLIVCKSCQKTKRNDGNENSESENQRVLINQSLMYMLALVFTWLWFLTYYIHVNIYELEVLNAVFFPLQGFWNLLIFLYDKTFHLRQADPELGFLQAVKKIIQSPSNALMIVVSDLPESTRPEIPNLDMEHLSYSKGEEQSSEKDLSMYDSISDYRNNRSAASHALSHEKDYSLAISSTDNGEEISYADEPRDNDKNCPPCNEYTYYGKQAESMGIKWG